MPIETKEFQALVLSWYALHGRHELPWRVDPQPYTVLVSELMLQQTQVERVIPKYQAFLKEFPTISALSQASLADVLRAWQGLGYYRRAKYLYNLAQEVVRHHHGQLPKDFKDLRSLPGIGEYTANAICTFAYNQPQVVIETNIRTVYIHHFFEDQDGKVSDTELRPLIEQTLYSQNPGEWYAALMDYGTYLKKNIGNLTQKSTHYTKQSKFDGSRRQVRASILRLVGQKDRSLEFLKANVVGNKKWFDEALNQLLQEGMIKKIDQESYSLAS